MRARTAAAFRLDGHIGWRTAFADAVSLGDALRLGADPLGRLSLADADESLGGVVLPRGLAVSEGGEVYLLSANDLAVKRFEAAAGRFVPLPTVGGSADDARGFREPVALAVAGDALAVVDAGLRRLQLFALPSLALRRVLGPYDRLGRTVSANDATAWEPADVVASGTALYLLDGRYGRVYRIDPRAEGPGTPLVNEPAAAGRWSRIAVDRDGRIYLLDAGGGALDAFDHDGRADGRIVEAGDVRGRFDPPPIVVDRGRFCLPASLVSVCDPRLPQPPPTPDAPFALCRADAGGRMFDLEGGPVHADPAEPPGPALYLRSGSWISEALDSEIYGCPWHRVEVELECLPPGSAIEVQTYSDARPLDIRDVRALPGDLWETRRVVAGSMQPLGGSTPPLAEEFLVQSRAGQYLWLKLSLRGDGYGTSAIRSIRIEYPRESYLEYLPDVFGTDDGSRWFLERFLSLVQTEWDEVERTIDDLPALFDPDAVPEGAPLEFLAGWLGLPLEGGWSSRQKRHVLAGYPALAARRGTSAAVRDYLRLSLESLTGLELDAIAYPQVVEGFRERAHLLLSATGVDELGRAAPLWSQSVVARLRIGVFAREGEVRLVSTGDPERDLFHEYAHRFRVFVPAAWVRLAEDERIVRRVLDSEKPAHSSYDLCLVEPRFRVGVQSTVGLDTIVGAYPRAALACQHRSDLPASLPPRHRLGYDTLLACPADHGSRVGDARAGLTATLS